MSARRERREPSPIRVTQVDYLDGLNKIGYTVPSDVLAKDPLIALNRNPEKFIGKTITFMALVTTNPIIKGNEAELVVQVVYAPHGGQSGLHHHERHRQPARQGRRRYDRHGDDHGVRRNDQTERDGQADCHGAKDRRRA